MGRQDEEPVSWRCQRAAGRLRGVYRTQGAEGSQPAMKIRRNEDMNKAYKIEDVNVRMNVMYNRCECYVMYCKK